MLRKTLACSMCGMLKSPAYTVAPVALPRASTRRSGLPTWRSSGRSTGGRGLVLHIVLIARLPFPVGILVAAAWMACTICP